MDNKHSTSIKAVKRSTRNTSTRRKSTRVRPNTPDKSRFLDISQYENGYESYGLENKNRADTSTRKTYSKRRIVIECVFIFIVVVIAVYMGLTLMSHSGLVLSEQDEPLQKLPGNTSTNTSIIRSTE